MSQNELFQRLALTSLAATALVTSVVGCSTSDKKKAPLPPVADFQPTPLGTISDPIWQRQEEMAEASDFVIHEHEWVGNSSKLNAAGMEHVKQIAMRGCLTPFPVLVERSSMSVDPNSQYKFPVNGHEELDMERRMLISQALLQMGMQDAEQRVIVAPALTPGFQDFEGENAYSQGFSNFGMNGNVGGNLGGGFGGGGVGGAF